MNISWISLRDLEYLVAVADQRHFGRAAESCHISQPALSAQIKKIEDVLETIVFERTNKRVSLTQTGAAIVEQARIVLDEARKILDLARKDSAPLTGSLRLGSIATLGPYFMPHLLAPLRRRYPRLELLLREGLTDKLIGELRDGKLDAVLASPTFDRHGLDEEPLFREPLVATFPKAHPLASKPNLSPADLSPQDMVLLEDGHCLRDQTLEACPHPQRGRSPKFQATSLETLRHLVASGLGYTLIPSLAVDTGGRLKGLLEYRQIKGGRLGRVISLYFRERYPYKQDLRALADFIRRNPPPGVSALNTTA